MDASYSIRYFSKDVIFYVLSGHLAFTITTRGVTIASWGHLLVVEAVAKANEANSDHMAEEEREGLTDFRQTARLELRHELAVEFAAFEALHVSGVTAVDQDPKKYIAEHV
jgi:predicted metal-dependent HD superfamily phosphohydrolase